MRKRRRGGQCRESFGEAIRRGVKIAFGTEPGVSRTAATAEFALMVRTACPAMAIRSATVDAAEHAWLSAKWGTNHAGQGRRHHRGRLRPDGQRRLLERGRLRDEVGAASQTGRRTATDQRGLTPLRRSMVAPTPWTFPRAAHSRDRGGTRAGPSVSPSRTVRRHEAHRRAQSVAITCARSCRPRRANRRAPRTSISAPIRRSSGTA